jgi:hypothetical protein
MTSTATLTFRAATAADARTLADLAALDSAAPLTGDVLLAEADGTAVAALSLADGRVVADPFARTAAVVEVLRVRARDLRTGRRGDAVRGLLRLAPASVRPA